MSAADIHRQFVAMCVQKLPQTISVSLSGKYQHWAIKKRISLSHSPTAQSSALQHVSDIMENMCIIIDELQLATSLS